MAYPLPIMGFPVAYSDYAGILDVRASHKVAN